MAISIEITPQPVVVGQPWHVKISGLRKNQDNIVLGAGWGDGNWMLHQYFTADANGVLEVDAPPLQIGIGSIPELDDDNQHTLTFNVLQLTGSQGNSKVLATQPYQIAR